MTQPDKRITATWPSREVKIISSHCANKIADFTPAEFQELEIKLITLQRFVGINQLIGDAEMTMLIEFLAEELKDFSLEEIENAIKLAVAGHIEVKIDHWQAFTAQYLYPIFCKYRLIRASVLNKYYNAEDKLRDIEKEKQKPMPSKEEQFLSDKRMCESAFENYKLTISIIGMYRVFDILWDLQLIPYKPEKMRQFEKMAAEELKAAARCGGIDKTLYDAYLYSLKSKIDLNDSAAQTKHPAEYETKLTGHNVIIHKTKEVATRHIFAYLVETKTEISTYFETLNLQANENK